VVRSGYDGPWTRNPLKFDNQYFKNLMGLEWKVKQWNGPLQFVDVLTEELMMLPTDMALRTDEKFCVWSELYARDEQTFFDDFAAAYGKLICLGCPESSDISVKAKRTELSKQQQASLSFREHAMHGSVLEMQKYRGVGADVQEREAMSGRTALHKAAFWGHDAATRYLVTECKAIVI
jgi:catalase (peroxidase I)